jgi:hypothetical protein
LNPKIAPFLVNLVVVFKYFKAPYRNGMLLKLLLQNVELPKMIGVTILEVAL